jgi:hypothetical protein
MSGIKKRTANNDREPPLKHRAWTEIDRETGDEIKVNVFERGILERETRNYKGRASETYDKEEAKRPAPRTILEQHRDELRQKLSDAGYPTYLQPNWVKTKDGKWNPLIRNQPIPADIVSRAVGKSEYEYLAPPLSEASLIGDLYAGLTNLLNMEGLTNDHFEQIMIVMDQHARLRVSELNSAVCQALKANEARSEGPKSVKKRAESVRAIVMRHATVFRKANRRYLHDASNTGASIAEAVIKVLR